MNHYENAILRPAVLKALAAEPEVIVHVAPVEKLTAVRGRTQSSAELGKGTPDLLLSVRWRVSGPPVDTVLRTDLMAAVCPGMPMQMPQLRPYVYGAAWVVQELKAPPCPGQADQLLLCMSCLELPRPDLDVVSTRCPCGGRRRPVARWSEGRVSKDQADLHAAWERGGRWVFVPRTPAEARAAIEEARRRLRAAGLEPVAVEGRG